MPTLPITKNYNVKAKNMDNMINMFMVLNGLEIANRYICLWHLGVHVKIPQWWERG